VQVRTIDLILGDCDAGDVNLVKSDKLTIVTRDVIHIGPSSKLTSRLTNTTASIQASHTWLDSHGYELVVVMSSEGLSKRLFVIQERSKVEFLVPCDLEGQCHQLVVAV
jgi:hypothetical protein